MAVGGAKEGPANAHCVLLALILLVLSAPTTANADGFSQPTATPRPLSVLIQDLQSPEVQTRRIAARELSTLKPLPPEAIGPLARSLRDSDPMLTVQNYATHALGNAGAPAVPVLVPLLEPGKGGNDQTRIAALRALAAIAKTEPSAFPPLIGALRNPVLQRWAPVLIAPIGAPIVPLLIKALQDPEAGVRRAAVQALQMRPGEASAAAPELIAQLNDPRPDVRAVAAADLGRIGPNAKGAAPALTALLKDPRPEVRDMAALALAKVDPGNQAPIPILIGALENRMSVAHSETLDVLKAMGANAHATIPTLEHLLATDSDARFRAAIVQTLTSIEESKSIPALLRTLQRDPGVGVRRAALDSIRRLLPTAPREVANSTITPLIQALRDEDEQIRNNAAETLPSMGEPAKPALISALHNQDLYIREGAVQALARHSLPSSSDVVRALTDTAFNDKSFVVRDQAAQALDRGGIPAGHTALEKAQQDLAGPQAPASSEAHRLYSRREVFADIPPDPDHEYSSQLVYLLSFDRSAESVPKSEMLAAVYRGKDRPDRLIFWRTAGSDRYQQALVIDAEPGTSLDPPAVVSIRKGQVPGLSVGFIRVGVDLWRGHADDLFAIDRNEVREVEIESPEQWYRSKLRPGDEIVGSASNSFHDRVAEFRFWIRNGSTTEQVIGTYKLVKTEPGTAVMAAWGMYAPSTGEKIVGETKPPTPAWKLVVDSAKREPLPIP